MFSFPRDIDYSRVNRTRVLIACGLATLAIAALDFAILRDLSLGFLYIIPLAVAAGFLDRWQIAAAALGLSALRQAATPPWMGDSFVHFATTAAAFAVTGWLIKELAVNQQYMRERAVHLEQKRDLEDQLRHAQRLEAVGRLAGGVAHDFNNLLSVIIGYSDFAMARVNDEPLRRDIEQIRKSADRAALLTRQLLVFSRRQKVEPRAVDVNEQVSNLDKMLRRLIGEDIDLQLMLDPGPLRVTADAGQIDQVLMNLAINARDAMPNGGRLAIETSELEIAGVNPLLPPEIQPGKYVRITVSDNGVGMDKHVQERIFEPFFTTKEVGKGTGLGLSVVYGLVRQNNGHIWFHSAPGEGTSFAIYLPFTGVSASEETGLPATALRRPCGSGSVLVVEDYAPVRSLAAEILRNHGYSVVAVSDGEEAVKIVRGGDCKFDLLLTDVVMPGMGGRELAADTVRRSPGTKVLYMSGYASDPLHGSPGAAAASMMLQKPFTADSLIHAVEAALGRAPRDIDATVS